MNNYRSLNTNNYNNYLINYADVSKLLLNKFSDVHSAYSLRKLNSNYTGSAIRVRRAIDNQEFDIGFINDRINMSQLQDSCLGDEILTNGDLSNSGQLAVVTFTLGWRITSSDITNGNEISITNNTLKLIHNGTGDCRVWATNGINQSLEPWVVGRKYLLKYRVVEKINHIQLRCYYNSAYNTIPSELGTNQVYITVTANTPNILVFSNSTVNSTIALDNISLKEVSDAYVTTWYDQNSNNDAIQLDNSKQPQISTDGEILLENGHPTLDFRTDTRYLQTGNFTQLVSPLSIFTVSKDLLITNGFRTILGSSQSSETFFGLSNSNTYMAFAGVGAVSGYVNNLQQTINFLLMNGSSSAISRNNEVETGLNVGTGTYFTNYRIGSNWDNGSNWDATIQEVIIFNADKSAQFEQILQEINEHYNTF
ncbi:MAG: hypothetical protein Wins2KO_04120 [Winogradskyella sp.]